MKRLVVIFILGLMLAGSGRVWATGGSDSLFHSANEAYKAEDFALAETLYQQLTDRGVKSADIYYNLGNSHFRQQDFARAILNYERALKLRPGDTHFRYNLNLANSFIKDDIIPAKKMLVFEWWAELSELLPPSLWLLLHVMMFLACLWLTGRFLIARSQRRKVRGFRLSVVMLAGSLAMLALSIQAHVATNRNREAIIMAERANIQSGPGLSDKTLGEYHSGTKVRILQQDAGWYEVKAADGHIGWVNVTDLEII
jgi:hypothetical protein